MGKKALQVFALLSVSAFKALKCRDQVESGVCRLGTERQRRDQRQAFRNQQSQNNPPGTSKLHAWVEEMTPTAKGQHKESRARSHRGRGDGAKGKGRSAPPPKKVRRGP